MFLIYQHVQGVESIRVLFTTISIVVVENCRQMETVADVTLRLPETPSVGHSVLSHWYQIRMICPSAEGSQG